jgi:peptide/nickel transport system ATP-binding protein/oligopeptide transport system ATP-binding protein
MSNDLLDVRNLKTYFYTEEGVVKALEGVNIKVGRKETLGVVGESGCGKSVTALSVLRLILPPGKILNGEIFFNGEDLLLKSEEEMRKVRGKQISMIFQDPNTSLNPVFTVGDQIHEAIKLHEALGRLEVKEKTINLFEKVGIPDALKRITDFPHQFSGGMKQRVMIAMALSCNPKLLIADEPTSNLDVTIQAQVLELMKDLKRESDSSVMLITHDFGVIAELSDKVAVMYAGHVVEYGDVFTIFQNPTHPYTKALLGSIPRFDIKKEIHEVIPGSVPNLLDPPTGCRFHPRCKDIFEICDKKIPSLIEVEKGHLAACLLFGEREDEEIL